MDRNDFNAVLYYYFLLPINEKELKRKFTSQEIAIHENAWIYTVSRERIFHSSNGVYVCVALCQSTTTRKKAPVKSDAESQPTSDTCGRRHCATTERNLLFIVVDRTTNSWFKTKFCACIACSMSLHLQYLLDELGGQAADAGEILNCKHERLLVNLSSEEKACIARACIDWDWNVGSIRLLRYLQMAHILTMSQYIVWVHNKNAEEAQLILNDLFEMEFSLLADLVQHMNSTNQTSIQIGDILQEGFRRLCADLCGNPALLSQNYLDALVPLVPDESMDFLKSIHLKLFLTESSKSTTEDAVRQQKRWTDQFDVEPKSSFNLFLDSITAGHSDHCKFFQNLLQYSQEDDFKFWRFYLAFLRCVARRASDEYFAVADHLKSMVKLFFKDAFQAFLTSRDTRKLHALMLNARQICGTNEEIIGTYAAWYKNTIGEMKYLIKNDEFVFVMETLIDMVRLENDLDILRTHINTYIPAPPLCNECVLNYVQMCKSRLSYRSTKSTANNDDPNRSRMSDQMEIIEID